MAGYKNTLLGEFWEDGCLDELRQLAADFGARPYRVFLVRTRFSGNKRGIGAEVLVSEKEITPPPKVEPPQSINRQLLDIGMDEQGGLSISEISPRYTENELLGLDPDGKGIPDNETFYYEVTLMREDPGSLRRRRYMIQGVPSFSATGLYWTVRLVRSGSDRTAPGIPR